MNLEWAPLVSLDIWSQCRGEEYFIVRDIGLFNHRDAWAWDPPLLAKHKRTKIIVMPLQLYY